MIQGFPTNLPTPQTAIADDSGRLQDTWYKVFVALFGRTGQGTGVQLKVGNDLVATGAGQADALQLLNDLNEVLGGATGGVLLTVTIQGQWQQVFNGSGGNINVYPTADLQIDALGANAPYILANGKTQNFTLYNMTTFRTFQPG